MRISRRWWRFEEANTNSVFRRPFRERCKTIIETQARTEVRMARIEGVDDIMHGESERQEEHDEEEECGNMKTMRHARHSSTERARKNRA